MVPSIFHYIDYRAYVRDSIDARRREDPKYSLCFFARRFGCCAGTLSKVLQHKRNISLELCMRIARALRLPKREREFLQLLVLYDQAADEAEKRDYLEQILAVRGGGAERMPDSQFPLFDTWYNIAVKELLTFREFRGDYEAVAKMLQPPITTDEAKQAIRALEQARLYVRGPHGRSRMVAKNVKTPERWQSASIAGYQRTMARMALEAIGRVDKAQRDFSTMTFSISPESMRRIKQKLDLLREEIHMIVKNDTGPDAVFHLNLQHFPLSHLPERWSHDDA